MIIPEKKAALYRALVEKRTEYDDKVWGLYSQDILSPIDPANVISLLVEENRKTLDVAQEIYNALITHNAKRNLTLVCIGGGITQDLGGFVASTLYRGVRWLFVPTTLLAQADSCIGGKTSLNYRNFINLIGTFYPPNEIFIHSRFLTTLTDLDFYSGLGEIVKLLAIP